MNNALKPSARNAALPLLSTAILDNASTKPDKPAGSAALHERLRALQDRAAFLRVLGDLFDEATQ